MVVGTLMMLVHVDRLLQLLLRWMIVVITVVVIIVSGRPSMVPNGRRRLTRHSGNTASFTRRTIRLNSIAAV